MTGGGPAFPIPAVMPTATNNGTQILMTPFTPAQPGMSLRDYFAAGAMQGMLASPGEALEDHLIEAYARCAFRIADAMLKERATSGEAA